MPRAVDEEVAVAPLSDAVSRDVVHLEGLHLLPGRGPLSQEVDRGVTSVGVDLIVKDAAFPIGSRPLTLFLTNDSGTPDNYDDDLWAWYTGDKEVPQAGEPISPMGGGGDGGTPAGWTDFDFDVPANIPVTPDPEPDRLALLRGRIRSEIDECYPSFAASAFTGTAA